MTRPRRTVLVALFLMSVFCMASCNRNWCDRFCSPCDMICPPLCHPCQPCAPGCGPCPPCPPRCAPYRPCGPVCYPCPSFAPDCNSCPPYSDECPPYQSCDPCAAPCQPPSCPPCQPSCGMPCQPYYAPCQPAYPCDSGEPCEPCGPCGPRPTCSPCAEPCSGCYTQEANPFFPCDPSAVPCGNSPYGSSYYPCGNGSCNDSHSFSERCFGQMLAYQTADECVVNLIQSAPESATVGAPYPIEVIVRAVKECANVKVQQTLPSDAEFLRSDPPAAPDQTGSLYWLFPHMAPGECQRIVIWVRPQKEGCCVACATVCACPQLCSVTRCTQPALCIKKWGPECVCLYCPACYTIEVCNSGSGTAYDVVLTDNIPDGLTHASGLKCLTYQLGDLCPGDSKRVNIELCANGRGTVTNTACVSYCGGPKCCAEWSTIINQPSLEVTKAGPDWAYICKVVDYTITVTNTGDLVLRDVTIDDLSPPGTTIVKAPGAEVCCNRAVWCIPEFCPGEVKTFTVSSRSQVAGCLVNKVTVSTQSDCGQYCACAEKMTCWKGIPGVHMCMVDTCNPVCLGETTVYRVCISNRGSADDTHVRLVLNFTNELLPY